MDSRLCCHRSVTWLGSNMDFRLMLVSTVFSAAVVFASTKNVHGEKHKVLVEVPTHIKQHVHTIYKIIKVPVFVKETKGRQDHHEDHDIPHKVEHTGKFEHQHLHKHLHEHHGELKSSPLHHHHYHNHEGGVGVNHEHKGTIAHQYHGKVAHGHSGTVEHDHLGFVGHLHGGGVGHQHRGLVGHYHGGIIGHRHDGKVGHNHDGLVGHTHLGIVGHGHIGNIDHKHGGHVGHDHRGLVGHGHFGNVRHGHDGSVGHGHAGHVPHGHGGYVGHEHNGHTSHVHAGQLGHNLGKTDHNNAAERPSYRSLQSLSLPEEIDDHTDNPAYHSMLPIRKPGYFEYSVGTPGRPTTRFHGSSPISSPILGIDEIATSIGRAIGEQNQIHSDEAEDEAGANDTDGGSVEYIDARLLRPKHLHQYEVFENQGF